MQQIQYDVRPGEFADAMKSTRAARMIFWLLLGAALIYQLTAFALVDLGGVLGSEGDLPAAMLAPAAAPNSPPPAPAKKPTPKPKPPAKPSPAAKAKAAAAKTPPKTGVPKTDPARGDDANQPSAPLAATNKPLTQAQKWHGVLRWSLPAAKFVAMASGMLLVLTLLFAVGLSLVGKLGGTAGLISAFFWSLILFMMVIPWQQVLGKTELACGALYNLGELLERRRTWGAAGDSTNDLFYYGRFVAYPGVALLIWLIVHVKFTRGAMRMTFPHALPGPVPAPAQAVTPQPQPSAPSANAAPAKRTVAQKAMAEKTQAGTGRGDSTPQPMGALTERLSQVRGEDAGEE